MDRLPSVTYCGRGQAFAHLEFQFQCHLFVLHVGH